MNRWIYISAAAVVALFALLWPAWRRSERRDDRDAAIEQLEESVRALRGELRDRRGAVETSTIAHQPRPESTPVAREAPTTPATEVPLTPEERNELATAELEERFHAEARDAAWSADMTRNIRSSMTASVPSARVLEADCASSLCRVVLSHQSRDEQRQIGLTLASVGPFRSGVYYDYDTKTEPPTTTLYVVREGRAFGESKKEL